MVRAFPAPIIGQNAASGAQVIDGSLKFVKESDHHLTRVMTDGNHGKFTISCWLKPTDQEDYLYLMGISSECSVYITNTRKLHADFYHPDGSTWAVLCDTDSVFRDPTAFYHLVITLDSSSGSSNADRFKVYVNGDQQPITFATYGTGTITGDVKHVNTNGQTFQINSRPGQTYYNSFYLSQYNYIDGLALGPGYFGFTDPLTGTWRPKKFKDSGTTVNDGRVFSSTGTFSNWNTGSYPKTELFDGTLYTGGTPNGASTSGAATAASFDFGDQQIRGFQNLQINIFLSSNQASATNIVSVNGVDITQECHSAGNNTWTTVDLGNKFTTLESFSIANYYIYVGGFIVDGVTMVDSTTTNLDFGTNGFYLPFDGNSPIGQDKSGNENDFTPVNFGGSTNSLDKATGALPILNTVSGGNYATPGTRTDSNASSVIFAAPLIDGAIDVSNQINSGSTTKSGTLSGATSESVSNFYGKSLVFDGSNDSISYTNQSEFVMGTSDFTMECWVYVHGTGSERTVFGLKHTGGSGWTGYKFYLNTNAAFIFYAEDAGSGGWDVALDAGNNTINVNRWQHLAVTRSGNTFRIFVDGVLKNSTTSSVDLNDTGSGFYIGQNGYDQQWMDGNIQDVRIYKGVAKYTSNFIPASTNPDILPDTPSGVSGSSKLTKIIDGAVHFGANASDKLRFPDSNDMSFGTNDFTFETYYYHESQGSFDIMFDNLGSNRSGSQFSINGSGNYAIEIGDGSGNWVWQHTSQPARVKRWTHFAVTRQGSTFRAFVDGVQFATTTSSTAIGNPQRNAVGGYTDEDSSNYGFNGFLSNMRIVNGTAVYTANFIPPTELLTNVNNTKLLCCQSNTSATDALVSPSQSVNNGTVWRNYVTANYTMYNYDGTLAPGDGSTGFDGDLATRIEDWNGVYNSNYSYQLEFIPPSPISYSSSVEVYTVAGPSAPYNNEFFIDTGSGYGSAIAHVQNSWVTLASGSGSVSKIKTTADQNGTSWTAIRIDGIILIDGSTNSIIAHGDAAATNFNPFNTDINTVRGQETSYPTLNPLDMRASTALSNGNLTVTGANADWYLARSTQFVSTGKYYWEFKWYGGAVTGSSGYQMGLKTPTSTLTAAAEQAGSYAFQYTSIYQTAGSTNTVVVSPGSTSAGDTVMFAYDADAGLMWFGVNGKWNDGANPALGTNSDWTSLPTTGLAPFAGTYNNIIKIDCNFGQKPFKYAPPDGFQPINAANLRPETVIARPDKFVKATTYTGNGGTQSINAGLKPDLVWIKRRNSTSDHQLYDSVRGDNKGLTSDQNLAEWDYGNGLMSFDPEGFTLGALGGANASNDTHVAWTWKAGGNKNTFNVDDVGYASAAAAGLDGGTITPTGASVGTKQGFSIIKFTNTTSDSTQSHGLTQKPDFIIWKKINGTSHWPIYHSSLGATKYLYLNLTNAASTGSEFWNNTEPTDSLVTTKGEPNSMGSAGDTIMYLWHNVPGLQKFGSCEGSGTSAAPDFVELGFKPSIVWVKRTDSTGNWTVWDSIRNTFNPSQKQLFPNTNGQESDLSADAIDILSNGFAIRSSSSFTQTGSQTYIYCAWAETPASNLYGGQSNAR